MIFGVESGSIFVRFCVILAIPGGVLGDLGASWEVQAPKIDFPRFLKPSGGHLGGQVGVQNFTLMLTKTS